MEDEIGLKGLEGGEDLGAVRHAAEALLDIERGGEVADLLGNRVEGQFRVIEQEQLPRLHDGDLPAELRADGAACARDEHPAPRDQVPQGRHIDVAGRAAQKVLDGDRRQLHRAGRFLEVGERL
jgi:hypothetical protein